MKFPIALKVRAKNGVLCKFIEEKGWSQKKFADEIGVSEQEVWTWFNLRGFPQTEKLMVKVYVLTGIPPEEIFPEFVKDSGFIKLSKTATLYKDIEVSYLSHDVFDQLEAPDRTDRRTECNEIKELIRSGIPSVLDKREAETICMIFGINKDREYTLDEISLHLNLTKERVRQIKDKALSKMQRSKKYKNINEERGTGLSGQGVEPLKTPPPGTGSGPRS